jgi:hypothetical protein
MPNQPSEPNKATTLPTHSKPYKISVTLLIILGTWGIAIVMFFIGRLFMTKTPSNALTVSAKASEGPMWTMSPVEVAIFMTLIVGALAWVPLA